MSKYKITFIIIFIILFLIVGGVESNYWNQRQVTENDEFFTLSIGPIPEIDINTWELKIDGLVENPIDLSYENLTSMPETEAVATIKCVEGPAGTAEWKGVKLSYILDLVEVQSGAKEVIFFAEDGYSSSLTLEDATSDDVILAYEMNGETLPKEHGFPVRLVVPGKYGYKWVKWINHIEVIDYDHKGFWESRGYLH